MRSPFSQDLLAQPKITVSEFSGLTIQVDGNITAGGFTVEISLAGRKGVAIPLKDVHTGAAIAADTGVDAEGIYRASVAGAQIAEVVYSEDFAYTGPLYITGFLASFLEGGAPGEGVLSVTASSPLASSGGQNPDISIAVATTALQSIRKNAANTAWEAFTPESGDITGITVTSPLTVTSGTGPIPAIALAGLSGVGSANQFPMSGGTTWSYVDSTGTNNVVRSGSPTLTGTIIAAAATFSGTVTFSLSAPVLSTVLSAPALATNGSGVVAAAATTGTGSTLVLSAGPTLTGTLTAAAATFSSTLTFSGILSAPALATNGSGVVAAAVTTGTGSTLALATNPTFAAFTNSSTMLTAGFSGFGNSTTTPAITSSLSEWETDGNTGTRLAMIAHGSASSNILWVRNTGGTKASPSATPASSNFISIEALGYTSSLQTGSNGYWAMMADALWSGSNAGVIHTWAGTPNGSTTRAEWMRLYRGNLVIGATASGATANKTLALSNTATSPSASVDLCHLYSLDISAGNAALAIYQEAPVSAAVATASTNKMPITINGTVYYALLTTVP